MRIQLHFTNRVYGMRLEHPLDESSISDLLVDLMEMDDIRRIDITYPGGDCRCVAVKNWATGGVTFGYPTPK